LILLDSREQDILPCFRPYGCELSTTTLEFGDACWSGNGAEGEGALLVGVERKKIRDLVNSMRDRRLGGFQAPGVASTYDVRYLVIEGIWQCGKTGALEELRGREWRVLGGTKKQPVLWVEVDSFLASLEEFFGFRVRQTKNEQETAAFIVSRYKYWQKAYEKHSTHKQVYAPEPTNGIGRKARFISLEDDIRRTCGPNAVYTWKMAAQLPGLDRRAEIVAREFKEPEEMFNATAKDWKRAGLGPKTVETLMGILHGGRK